MRNELEASFLYPLRSNAGLASRISHFEILDGDWKEMLRYQEAVKAVAAAQIQDVARRTFAASNRTVAVLARPRAEGADEPAQGVAAPAPEK